MSDTYQKSSRGSHNSSKKPRSGNSAGTIRTSYKKESIRRKKARQKKLILRIFFFALILLLAFILIKKIKSNLNNNSDPSDEGTFYNEATTGPALDVEPEPTEEPLVSIPFDASGPDPDKPMVAITFDDGPNPSTTGRILDTLAKYNAHATFFVVGNRLKNCEETLNRQLEIGCEIGSHSFDHAKLSDLKKDDIKAEFKKTNDVLKKLTGTGAHIVRTPFGETESRVMKNTKYPVILWSVDTEDWKSRNKKTVTKRIMSTVQDGDIILMHDLYESTADAVEIVVPQLIKQGYQLVTVSELMKAKGIELKPGEYYTSGKK